jgi:hypothetical protein
MKTLEQILGEARARAIPCGRCGTKHIPPSQGGTCPALKEATDDLSEGRAARAARVANVGFDAASIGSGVSSGDIAAPAAVEAAARRGQAAAARGGMTRTATALGRTATAARFVGQAHSMNTVGRAAASGASRVAPRVAASGAGRIAGAVAGKLAWPIALGMGAYDAYRGYNAQPNAPVTTRLRNAGQNALSGLTLGLVSAPRGVNETTGNSNMKTLTQFMAEANANCYVEEQEELSPETQAIIDAINEAVGDRELSQEEFDEIYSYVVESLEAELDLDEAHDIELKPHGDKGTHYKVHKISKTSGIEADQLKTGETLNDTHVDDLKDMGYSVKIHNG